MVFVIGAQIKGPFELRAAISLLNWFMVLPVIGLAWLLGRWLAGRYARKHIEPAWGILNKQWLRLRDERQKFTAHVDRHAKEGSHILITDPVLKEKWEHYREAAERLEAAMEKLNQESK